MIEENQQDDVMAKRLILGREAKLLLQNPLIEGFFADHYAACYKAFCDLQMGSDIENYRTVHHDFMALQRLYDSLQAYITQAEVDTFERKQQDAIPEDISI